MDTIVIRDDDLLALGAAVGLDAPDYARTSSVEASLVRRTPHSRLRGSRWGRRGCR